MDSLLIVGVTGLIFGFAGWVIGMGCGFFRADKNAAERGWLTHENVVYSVRKHYMGD